MARELERFVQIEQSINKKFRKEIWNNFVAAVKRYRLIDANDRIAVCISGGKDSMLLAVLLRMLQRYSEVRFDLEFIRCACKFTEKSTCDDGSSKRLETKNLIKELKKTNPDIEINLFNSIHKCNVDTLVGYKLKGKSHSFLERFEKIVEADENP